MCKARVIIVVPTLHAGAALAECLESIERQTFRDFAVVVADNSGRGLVRAMGALPPWVTPIENESNVGFGRAINQGAAEGESQFVAVLNDDARARPEWLEAMVRAMEERYEIGMCAPLVILAGEERLDSAGMLICGDGSSKQRGHGEGGERYGRREEALLPSGSAALYRRDMLDEVGGFDESFFLYCEDTDLGLRARWAGWECMFVPEALVEHRYSHSAGRASSLKAFYVERNRLFLTVKNFPMPMLLAAPFVALARYAWHGYYAWQGKGAAGRFVGETGGAMELAGCVWRAHVALLRNWGALWAKRRQVKRRLTPKQFTRLTRRYAITARKVAAQ